MRKVLMLFLLFSVFFTGQQIKGQVVPDKFPVGVDVTCDDSITKGQIESYLKRELRSLGDVTIEGSAIYRLSLVVLEPKFTSTGHKSGDIIISSVFTKVYSLPKILEYYAPLTFELKRDEINDKIIENILVKDAPLFAYIHYINNYVTYDRTNNLRNICEGIIAKFDTDVLEKERQKQ